ncbi:uncharacterized protein LOC108034407 [Drosophila biarmipes]|uniref:uncharacterized protein LOC108034407 n=1 Tax=Drosophila biarmipes TaxID=125945 RepID=UPI0021CCFF3F|nr:uncharacterized protein LOC108034407 [Drosophila biarmipes]
MRNNKADNTQRQKLGLQRRRQRQRRVWGLTVGVEIVETFQKESGPDAQLKKRQRNENFNKNSFMRYPF